MAKLLLSKEVNQRSLEDHKSEIREFISRENAIKLNPWAIRGHYKSLDDVLGNKVYGLNAQYNIHNKASTPNDEKDISTVSPINDICQSLNSDNEMKLSYNNVYNEATKLKISNYSHLGSPSMSLETLTKFNSEPTTSPIQNANDDQNLHKLLSKTAKNEIAIGECSSNSSSSDFINMKISLTFLKQAKSVTPKISDPRGKKQRGRKMKPIFRIEKV